MLRLKNSMRHKSLTTRLWRLDLYCLSHRDHAPNLLADHLRLDIGERLKNPLRPRYQILGLHKANPLGASAIAQEMDLQPHAPNVDKRRLQRNYLHLRKLLFVSRSLLGLEQALMLIVSSSPHSQTIIFDVSQPLESTLAPQNSVKATAIALVKIEPVFLPGSTIGATSWIAYAMTKGNIIDHVCILYLNLMHRPRQDHQSFQWGSHPLTTATFVPPIVVGDRHGCIWQPASWSNL